MKVRFLAVVVVAIVAVMIWAVAIYEPKVSNDPIRSADFYELDIAFCEEQATPCTEVSSTSSATLFANVVATKDVGTLVVQLETDSPVLGTVKHDEFYVRRGDTYSGFVELSRDASCRTLPCTVSVTVYIQYQLVLTESVTFT